MTVPVQIRAKRSGSKSTTSSASLGTQERRARPFAVNEPGDAHEQDAERNVYAMGSDAPAVNGFSFSRVSVLGLQRKCACGGIAGPTGECAECGNKRRLGLQPRMRVNRPGDAYEQEADRVADQALAAPAHLSASGAPLRIQRLTGQATEGTNVAPASVDHVIASSGTPLEPALRQDMEQRFGHGFSRVRLHFGPAAEQSAREMNADAYTVGHNIVFGAARFAPGAYEGRRLIAHELTHVVQQTGASRKQNATAEHAADAMANHAPGTGTGLAIARKPRTGATAAPLPAVRMMAREEAREVLAGYIATAGDDTLGAMNAIEATLRMPSTVENWKMRLRVLTAAFSLLNADGAARVLKALTNPVGANQKHLRERFERLDSDFRRPLLEILRERASAKHAREEEKADEPLEEEPLKGGATWIELHEGVFAYLPNAETTIDKVAAYVSGHPDMPAALAKLNRIPRNQPIPAEQPVIVPVEFIDRPKAFREMPEHVRGRIVAMHEDLAHRARIRRHGKVTSGHPLGPGAFGLIPVTTAAIEATISGLGKVLGKVAYAVSFIAGIIHGFLSSLWDALSGIAELAYSIVKSVFTLSVVSDAKKLGKVISDMTWEDIKEALGEWAAKWDAKLKSDSPWVAGHAHGYLTGYVMAEAAMLLLSFGATAELKGALWATRLGQAVKESRAFRTLASGIEKAGQASEKARAVLAQTQAALAKTRAVQALAAARRTVAGALRLPFQVVDNLGAEAIERLAQLSEPLRARIRDLSARAKIWLLGCRSACRVDLEFMRNRLKRMTNKEIDDYVARLDEVAETPKVKGGKIDDRRVPTGKVRRMEAEDIPRVTKTETLEQAKARIQTVIGKTIADDPALRRLWDEAASEVMRGKRLTKGNAATMYDRTRNKFWQKVRDNPDLFRDAGFALPRSKTRAPYLRGMRKNIPDAEITISLDHSAEKAIASNWKRALDPTNLVYEFAAPNSWREIIQMRHPVLRP